MKKKSVKSLILNKKSVSNLNEETLKGGNSVLCTGLFGSCWCDVTVTDCNCPRRSERGWCPPQQ
ncbi:class I lanthipeptide [Kordia sp.]|uniref:class I lanthipeptide n=1 Tax=Kordia sp. TaxID=1965332 RepID=UPI0025BCDB84|nr:class I lanthipeptide [Kordia sp.]MCH2193209.1 class I lanthipeptide [Kordia sp.]